jgi:hypothetical protein
MAALTTLEEQLKAANRKPALKQEPAAEEETRPAAPGSRQKAAPETSREDKAHVGAWLHKDFKRSLLLARAETGEDVQTFFARVLNAEFKARGVPVVNK